MKKILIADELSFCRELLAFALRHHRYDVVTAEDGLGAIDMVRREKPDLAILDARLPKIDGLAVLRVIRSSPDFRHVPVFMLTATENRQHLLQAVQIGVQEYILKSQFDLETMMGRIRKCIGTPMEACSTSVVAEIWDNAAMPAKTGECEIEIEGEMEAAMVLKKVER